MALPKSNLAKAVTYARNQWVALRRYSEDGRLTIDNNVSERTLRHQAIGRKNPGCSWAAKLRGRALRCCPRSWRAPSAITSNLGPTSATFWSASMQTTRIWRSCCPTAGPRRTPRRSSVTAWKSHEPKPSAPAPAGLIAVPAEKTIPASLDPPWSGRTLTKNRGCCNGASPR